MGYSVSTPCKSPKALRTMLGFLLEHYRRWSEVSEQKYDYATKPLEDLSYDQGGCKIGFDYNASMAERDYIFDICRFMALRVGRLGRWDDFRDPAPYILYDGFDRYPVLDKTQWEYVPKGWRWAKVHPWGESIRHCCLDPALRRCRPGLDDEERQDIKHHMKLIRTELQRLSALW